MHYFTLQEAIAALKHAEPRLDPNGELDGEGDGVVSFTLVIERHEGPESARSSGATCAESAEDLTGPAPSSQG